MKNKRSLWVSLISVIAISTIALVAVLAAGWSPKLGPTARWIKPSWTPSSPSWANG